jgi:anthranilate phosphoribosyltransferase
MRQHATRIGCSRGNILDTCGTGGDRSQTFNISTISALVAAGAGAVVAKHGNRAVSSRCGSADLLKELGVNIEASVGVVEKCLKEIGIAFLFAPLLHESMKYAAPIRREIGIRTIFNILGPMTNPACAKHHLLGVFNAGLTRPLASALGKLGSRHVLVVCGRDGLDEITTTAETTVSELKNGRVKTYRIKPSDFGIKRARSADLKGQDPGFNARLTLDLLNGKKGPQRDIVVLNAGAALYAADMAKSIKDGIALAQESIDGLKAKGKLEALKRLTNEG